MYVVDLFFVVGRKIGKVQNVKKRAIMGAAPGQEHVLKSGKRLILVFKLGISA